MVQYVGLPTAVCPTPRDSVWNTLRSAVSHRALFHISGSQRFGKFGPVPSAGLWPGPVVPLPPVPNAPLSLMYSLQNEPSLEVMTPGFVGTARRPDALSPTVA